ncbi:MAG TPA: hypothetical protein VIG80_16420 [Bacillaceae bacterium]
MYRNEKGAVLPIALLIAMLAVFILVEASAIYVSERGYVTEMRNYYNRETEQLLQKMPAKEDELHVPVDYNGEN